MFSGRNNILLWLTNWEHSTFILLHRWVARLMGLQIILHSVLELALYINKGTYAAELKEQYWIWGAVATAASSAMLFFNPLYFRRTSYEIFFIMHIILAVFILVGSWYHVELLYTRKWGYEFWLYAAFGVWIFDRTLRVLRIVKVGVRYSKVVDIDGNIVRIDVPGVRWGGSPGVHAYAFFPTLGELKPWENHPFSVVPTSMLLSKKAVSREGSLFSTPSDKDAERNGHRPVVSELGQSQRETGTTAGVTLYIKKSTGITKFLSGHDKLLTLLEGPYGHTSLSSSNTILKCDRLILIAGGIGITAVLPFISSHPNVKLAWSMKREMEGMVRELNPVLEGLEEREKTVVVSGRIDLTGLLEEEGQRGWGNIGVVVCGLGDMGDMVREQVVGLGKKGVAVKLLVEAFCW